MLKILMDSSEFDKYLKDKRFIEFPSMHFNRVKKAEWFKDPFVRKIIQEIDKASVELDFSVINNETHIGYSVDSLSGGSKFLILAYECSDRIMLATMGDNCTDLLEQIALYYEKNGKDLIIVSNYLHRFKFNYIKSIEYINWGIVCHSWMDIHDKVYDRYLNHEKSKRALWEDDEVD